MAPCVETGRSDNLSRETADHLLYDNRGDSFVEFLRDVDDLVMIHTHNRPYLIAEQILAFISNREGFRAGGFKERDIYRDSKLKTNKESSSAQVRKQLFVVMEDSDPEYGQAYHKILGELSFSIPPELSKMYRVVYVDKNTQKGLLDALPSDLHPVVFDLTTDYISKKFGGMRAIQNISEMVALFYAGFAMEYGKVPLIHKVDDDIFPGSIAVGDDNSMNVGFFYDIFPHKAKLLNVAPGPDRNRMLTSHYSGHSPSPIYTIEEYVLSLFKMMELTHPEDAEDPQVWQRFLSSLPLTTPRVSRVIYDQIPPFLEAAFHEQLLTPTYPGQSPNMKDFITHSLPSHQVLVENGVNQLSLDSTTDAVKAGWYGPIGVGPGGFNSYRADNRWVPSNPPFGNQDLLRSALYRGLGGYLIGDWDVLHLKGDHPPLLADLSSDSLRSPRHTFLLSAAITQAMEEDLNRKGYSLNAGLRSSQTVFEECYRFAGAGNKFIADMAEQIRHIHSGGANPDNWWNKSPQTKRVMDEIGKYAEHLILHLPEIIREFSVDEIPNDLKKIAREMYQWWIGKEDNWQKAMDVYRNTSKSISLPESVSHIATVPYKQDGVVYFHAPQKRTMPSWTIPSGARTFLRGVIPDREAKRKELGGIFRLQDGLDRVFPGTYVVSELPQDDQFREVLTSPETGENMFMLLEHLLNHDGRNLFSRDDQLPDGRLILTGGRDGKDYRYDTLNNYPDLYSAGTHFIRFGTTQREDGKLSDTIEGQITKYIDPEICYFTLYSIPDHLPLAGESGRRPTIKMDHRVGLGVYERMIMDSLPDSSEYTATGLSLGGVLLTRPDQTPVISGNNYDVLGAALAVETRESTRSIHGRVFPIVRPK